MVTEILNPNTDKDHKDSDYDLKALRACVEIGKILTSTHDLPKILALIMEKISDLIAAQNWSLLLRDDASGELTFDIVVGVNRDLLKGLRIGPGQGIAGRASTTGETIFIEDVSQTPEFFHGVDQHTGFHTQSILCLPLKTHGHVMGVIEIVNISNIDDFKVKELPILTTLADYAAIAIENSLFLKKIERMSITDEYTGLYNSRYLHQILDRLIEAPKETENTVAVVFMDIDNFKQIVDTYGHLQGTHILKEIGEAVGGCLDPGDILIKYGGDEYVIVMPGRVRKTATEVIQRIIESLRGQTFLKSETSPVSVTASFGMAIFPEDAQNKKDLLLAADQAMFRVKNTTKNGMAIYR